MSNLTPVPANKPPPSSGGSSSSEGANRSPALLDGGRSCDVDDGSCDTLLAVLSRLFFFFFGFFFFFVSFSEPHPSSSSWGGLFPTPSLAANSACRSLTSSSSELSWGVGNYRGSLISACYLVSGVSGCGVHQPTPCPLITEASLTLTVREQAIITSRQHLMTGESILESALTKMLGFSERLEGYSNPEWAINSYFYSPQKQVQNRIFILTRSSESFQITLLDQRN